VNDYALVIHGEAVKLLLVHGMLITFYADHAVKELRVTEIEAV
jgi:hypothetical protein